MEFNSRDIILGQNEVLSLVKELYQENRDFSNSKLIFEISYFTNGIQVFKELKVDPVEWIILSKESFEVKSSEKHNLLKHTLSQNDLVINLN